MTEPLPLHDRHRAAGARFHERAGHHRPADYGEPAAEERALFEATGLFDVSDTEWVAVTGADRARFLQGMVTNDVVALKPGEGCRAAWLTAKARVQMLLAVLAEADRLLLRLPPGQAEPFVAALDRYVIMEDVTFERLRGRVGLALEGPGAGALLAAVSAGPAGQGAGDAFDAVDLGALTAPPGDLRHRTVDVSGAGPVRVVSSSVTPSGGVELWAETPDAGRALWDVLLATGAGRGLGPVGDDALEAARIAAGTLVFGADVDTETFMPELPLTGWVSFKKGCYLGQEPVARVHFRGRPVRQVAGLVFTDAGNAPPARLALRAPPDDKEVGLVSSTAYSHRLGRPIGLGLVRREHLAPGTRLEATHGERTVAVEVRAFPIDASPVPVPPPEMPRV